MISYSGSGAVLIIVIRVSVTNIMGITNRIGIVIGVKSGIED